MPGKVKVKIISGRNLPVMDRSSDTTDAYVEIKLGSITYKTDVCRKSLHPQWNSDWYRFEVDDAELQDEPLQIRLMDHDTYSANDAIGKVYIDLNPLLLPASSLLLKWNGEPTISLESCTNSAMSGWIPVYDTMHGIRGEVNIVVKVELFSDFNKFRQSSCGVQFFCSPVIPHGFYSQVIHGFVEELVVNDDPEYQWIDKIRTPRASNEARQTIFFKLSGELQRKIGLKALDLGANAVIGYTQYYDLEGESGIVARGIGTAVTLVKLLDVPIPQGLDNEGEERAQSYLKFLSSDSGFRLNSEPRNVLTNKYHPIPPFKSFPKEKAKPEIEVPKIKRYNSQTIPKAPNKIIEDHLQHSASLQTVLKQEDLRRPKGSSFTQRLKNIKYSSQSALSKTVSAIKSKFSDTTLNEHKSETPVSADNSKTKKKKNFIRTNSDSSLMAEILVRSAIEAQLNLDQIPESQDSPPKGSSYTKQISCVADPMKENSSENKPLDSFLSLPDDFLETGSSNASSATESSSEDEISDAKDTSVVWDTISDIVKNVEEKMHLQQMNMSISQEKDIDLSNSGSEEDQNQDELLFAISDKTVIPLHDDIFPPEERKKFQERVSFTLGGTDTEKNSPAIDIVEQKRNPFNFGDLTKTHLFSHDNKESNLETAMAEHIEPLVPQSVEAIEEEIPTSRRPSKSSLKEKLHIIANAALHNVLMDKLRDKLHSHDSKDEILKSSVITPEVIVSEKNERELKEPEMGEKKRSYVDIMDLQTNPMHYNPLPRKIDFSVFNSKFLDCPKGSNNLGPVSSNVGVMNKNDEPKSSPLRANTKVDSHMKSNVNQPSLIQLALGNVVKETANEMMATAHVEEDKNLVFKSQKFPPSVTEQCSSSLSTEQKHQSHVSPSLLHLALGNMIQETAQDLMATVQIDSENKILQPVPSQSNDDKLGAKRQSSMKITKKEKRANKASNSPSLLQMALGNVLRDTAQDMMATAHVDNKGKTENESLEEITQKENDNKKRTPLPPNLVPLTLGHAIKDTAQDMMATTRISSNNANPEQTTVLPKTKIVVTKEPSVDSSQEDDTIQSALSTVLLETVHDIILKSKPEPSDVETTNRNINTNLFTNMNFRTLRRSFDLGSIRHEDVDSENLATDALNTEHEITHSRVYHALVDKFKEIVANMHLKDSERQESPPSSPTRKSISSVKSHSLLQTALQNILAESINDTIAISNEINTTPSPEVKPLRKTSSLLELSKTEILYEGDKVSIEKKHHNFLQHIMHNVLTDKIHAFTKHHLFHEKAKEKGSLQDLDGSSSPSPISITPTPPLNNEPADFDQTINNACNNNVQSQSSSMPLNTEIDCGNNINTTHARLTHFHRHMESPHQEAIKIEHGHQRAESMGAKMSQSPAKVYTIPNIHRRSSDSDLSITPKGNSFTGSDRSGGCLGGHFMRNNIMRSTVPQENFNILEYPFLTMHKYPPGFITYIGGSVSARSVKLLERISNPEEPESRDTWWSEIRMEIRSHARSLNCNAVLGYTETTSICDDVCVLSANGTAALIGYHGEINDNVGPLPFVPKQNPSKDMTSSLDRNDFEKEKLDKKGVEPVAKSSSPETETYIPVATSCTICHLPYNATSLPMRSNSSKCLVCRAAKVPDILIATIEIPDGAPLVGRGCFIQSYVCRPLRDLKGESNAKEISDGLPFLEYELHRLLVNKLKIRGMNAIFGLKVRISTGERTLMATATGTAVYLSPLPTPALPKLVCDRDADERKIAHLQKNLHDIVKKNIEIYQIKPEGETHSRPIADTEESEDEQTLSDLSLGNKDCCVLEIDDPEDREVLNLLLEPRPPDGFHVVNTEHVPGLHDLEIVKNLQMFTQIWRAKIQPPYNLDKHFHKLLETVYFKLRRMVPCALCDLQFRVDTPEPDEIQLCVLGMALGLGDPQKNPKMKRKPLHKKNEEDLIFKMEDDHIPENSVPLLPQSNFLHTQALKYRPKSPSRIKIINSKYKHVPYRERHGVDITPLSYVPGGKIEKYLGNLNFFFIRETTSIREEGGLSGFLHSFITEVLAIIRAHVTALGGNAMVAYFMTECILNHNLHKNQGQCLINVGGDVVHVSYFSEDQ